MFHSCLGSQAKYIVLWANRRVNVTCRLKRYLIRFPRSACKTDVNIDRSLLSLLSSVLWTECIVKLDFSFFFTGCETDRRKIVLALSWRSLENYHQILYLYRRRQANENENSWSRYINEETNAKINSSYNYLEVEILSEKKHRKEWQDGLQTVPKKQKLPDPCTLSLLAHHCLVWKRLIWITRPHSKHDFTSEPQSYLKGSWWKTWEVWNVEQKCWLKTLRRCNYQRSPEPFKIIFPKKIVYEWHPS